MKKLIGIVLVLAMVAVMFGCTAPAEEAAAPAEEAAAPAEEAVEMIEVDLLVPAHIRCLNTRTDVSAVL